MIADGYSAELDELRGLQSNAGEYLVALETKSARTGIPNLRVAYRCARYYIEVTNTPTRSRSTTGAARR